MNWHLHGGGGPPGAEHDLRASEAALIDRLKRIGAGEETAAEALGISPKTIDDLVQRARALFTAGRCEAGDRLLSALVLTEGRSVALPFMLGALRVQHGQMLAGASSRQGRTPSPRKRACGLT